MGRISGSHGGEYEDDFIALMTETSPGQLDQFLRDYAVNHPIKLVFAVAVRT
jgi:hypothetical protein